MPPFGAQHAHARGGGLFQQPRVAGAWPVRGDGRQRGPCGAARVRGAVCAPLRQAPCCCRSRGRMPAGPAAPSGCGGLAWRSREHHPAMPRRGVAWRGAPHLDTRSPNWSAANATVPTLAAITTGGYHLGHDPSCMHARPRTQSTRSALVVGLCPCARCVRCCAGVPPSLQQGPGTGCR
jgi:hypothetical protein